MTKSKSAYSIPGKIGKLERHIIVVWVDNEAGVLARISGLFSGRGYNIESLTVSVVDKKKKTVVTPFCEKVSSSIDRRLLSVCRLSILIRFCVCVKRCISTKQ